MTELSLTISNPKTHVYGPGDAISGYASFVPLFSARLRSLTISLQGYCYTSSIAANSKVSHSVPFLHLSTSTMEETYTYVSERYEAPFSFVFPEDTDVVHEAGPERLRSLFNQEAQALPSSVVISARNCMQTVRYVVHVEIHGRSRATCEETVLFRQPADRLRDYCDVKEQEEIRQQDEDMSHRETADAPASPLLDETWQSNKAIYYNRADTIRLSDDEDAPKLSLHALPLISTRQKSTIAKYKYATSNKKRGTSHWLFKSWKNPEIVFMPSIYCPQRIAIGQEIPLLLAVDTIKNPVWRGMTEDQKLMLEEFSLAVTAHSRTIMQNRPHKRRWGRCLELSYAVLQATGLSAPISIDGVPTSLVQNFKILPGAIPSFSTYTLSRDYTIDVFFSFSFGDENLEFGASLNLTITADESVSPVEGANLDPLLFIDPRREPQYFWHSRIEAGAAESTSRSDIYPGRAGDAVNMPGVQRETGHGRLPRTSYACASAQVRPELLPVKAGRGKAGAFSIIAGNTGKPFRRYLRDLEPTVMPLFTFKHGLGFDGISDGVTVVDRLAMLDERRKTKRSCSEREP